MAEDLTGPVLAALRELPERRDEFADLLLVVRGLVDLGEGVHLRVRQAGDGLAAGHAARVHGHHVVPRADRLRVADPGVALQVADRGAAGAAGVDQQ
jgi:hypothetical protein